MTGLLSFVCLALAMVGQTSSDDLTVSLPLGETMLGDIALHRVTYQSYGGAPVEMPLGWTGHFTEDTGISYVPDARLMERSAILLHSPWRVRPGKVWVDYRLRLPDVRPITLCFGIAMAPDVAVPGKSDGATFSCLALHAGREEQLVREHYDQSRWRDFELDLSRLAGQEVTLRLRVEPGPRSDPSWDYSYFGDARIVAGLAEQGRKELLARLSSSRAYRATEAAGVRPLANGNRRGVVPSNILPCTNRVVRVGARYQFTYEGKDCRVVYTYEPLTGTLDDFWVQVDDGPPFQPAVGGGLTVALASAEGRRRVPVRGGALSEVALSAARPALNLVWDYDVEGRRLSVPWAFEIVGKALVISVRCDEPAVGAFSLGEVGPVPFKRRFDVPYLSGQVAYLSAQQAFVSRYLDWTVSHSSQCPQGTATYEPKTDGTLNPLLEEGFVAVSPNVDEVLPNIPHPASPYRELLAPLVVLDVWGGGPGRTFQSDAANLRRLKDNGVDHLCVIQHVWQRYGYDVKLPDHLPANAGLGGDEGMAEFGRAADECGYLWSLHENYIDLYPDAPSYDATAVALRQDGTPSPAWYNAWTGVQSFGLKCTRALGYAERNSPEIHRRYGTTAAYLDVHTCVPPWHQLDHDAAQPMAAMALGRVKHDAELFQFLRDAHGAPLLGEGANHFYWAGLCDAVEAQVVGGEHVLPFLDFDLLKVHAQMVNHGMGYYERWFERGYGIQWGVDAGTVEDVDKYRAQEVGWGHAGFIGGAQVENVQWVAKEHHMMHPVQRLCGAAQPTEIMYEVDGRFLTASAALPLGRLSRQRVRYGSGFTVWVNWDEEPWQVEGHVLPQWGFLALGPGTRIFTALNDGALADYAECPEYVFADARTHFAMPYVRREKDIEPRLREFAYLGGNRIRITYEWLVNDTLSEDYACFVHFTSERSDRPERIEFQQDHALSKPSTQWRAGETIVGGPYEVVLPENAQDTYDILIGLYKEQRVPLKGANTAGDRVLIGRLRVERRADYVTAITLADVGEAARALTVPRADFTRGLNPPGTWVDFGMIATDGSAKVSRGPEGLTVFPYPRDTAFRLEMDVKALAPQARLARLRVRALAASTREDMGPVEFVVRGSRLSFTLGRLGAGCYAVTW
jgi:hypothetical protein